ncbi:unnamed protein product [Mesocestoides corti]|nr:unnamed protein product [Mesocestoides corti]
MRNFTTPQSARCASSGCECKAFLPTINAVRQCSSCSHSWVFHACSKFQSLPPFFGTSIKSDPNLIIVMFETMGMALLGCHSIPTRIKILLDRIWSTSRLQVDLTQFLLSFGWTLQDYTRGYMLTDHRGQLRDRWVCCRIEEETVIIQQFLRFLETRHLAHDMLASLDAEKSQFPRENLPQPQPPADYLLGPLPPNLAGKQEAMKKDSAELPTAFPTVNLGTDLSARFVAAMAAAAFTSKMPFPKLPGSLPMPPLLPPWCKADNTTPSSSEALPIPPIPSFPFPPPPIPTSSTASMEVIDATAGAFKASVNDRKKCLGDLFDIWSTPFTNIPESKATSSDQKMEPRTPMDFTTDLSGPGKTPAYQRSPRATSTKKMSSEYKRPHHSGGSSSAFSDCKQEGRQGTATVQRDPLALNLTGRNKKRVLCTTCKKSFCDKGALKIHFSAVHLREMHKCTIRGCNMWFSSRRSRNRHSANPNPRLHVTHPGKRLPENAAIVDDGSGETVFQRSQMPSAVLNPPILSPFIARSPSPQGSLLNQSDPGIQIASSLCQSQGEMQRQTPESSDEGIFIPEREKESEEGSLSCHSNHRSPTTEFSAFNLAQSSPSPSSSHHCSTSPLQLHNSSLSDENKGFGSAPQA